MLFFKCNPGMKFTNSVLYKIEDHLFKESKDNHDGTRRLLESSNLKEIYETFDRNGRTIIQLKKEHVEPFIDGDNDCLTDFEKQIHGTIVDTNNPSVIICPSLPLANECSAPFVAHLDDNHQIVPTIDGTLIRMYHFNGYWELSTSKMINAFHAFSWTLDIYKEEDPLDSYGAIFMDIVCKHGMDFASLNKKMVYYFVIRHPKLYMTFPCHKPELNLICTYDRIACEFEFLDLETTSSESIRGTTYICQQGGKMVRYKLDNEAFKELKELQGDDIDPIVRYLKLSLEPAKQKLFAQKYLDDYCLGMIECIESFSLDLVHLAKRSDVLNKNKIYNKLKVSYVPFKQLYDLIGKILDDDFFSSLKQIQSKYAFLIVILYQESEHWVGNKVVTSRPLSQ